MTVVKAKIPIGIESIIRAQSAFMADIVILGFRSIKIQSQFVIQFELISPTLDLIFQAWIDSGNEVALGVVLG